MHQTLLVELIVFDVKQPLQALLGDPFFIQQRCIHTTRLGVPTVCVCVSTPTKIVTYKTTPQNDYST